VDSLDFGAMGRMMFATKNRCHTYCAVYQLLARECDTIFSVICDGVCLFFGWCLLQLLQCSAQLVGTGGALGTTADAVQAGDDIVYTLASHQLTDALQVAIASTQKEHLLDDIVLVGCYVNELRARSVRLVLYMFCLHITLRLLILLQNYELLSNQQALATSIFA